MNSVFLTGRLVRDPDIRSTQNQKRVARFTIAVDRGYKGADGEHQADYPTCIAWENAAAYLEKYGRKGSRIGVVGSVRTRKWQDEDGDTRYATEINCDRVELYSFLSNVHDRRRDENPRFERPARTPETESDGSGYEVYAPPGFEDMDDGSGLY